jgi:hypothetical protein
MSRFQNLQTESSNYCPDPNCQSCNDLREAQEKVTTGSAPNHGENRAAIGSDREVLWLRQLGWQCVQEEIPTLSLVGNPVEGERDSGLKLNAIPL